MIPPLRAFGRSPEDLREMLTDWWLKPLSGALLEAAPHVKHLSLAARALPGDRVALRLVPGDVVHGLDPAWDLRVEATHQRLFCAPMDTLDADEGAARAFGAFVSDDPGEWTTVLRVSRVRPGWRVDEGERTFIVELQDLGHRRRPDAEAPAERARAARIAAPVVDPDVAAVLSGLEALDRRDLLLQRCAALARVRARREPEALICAALFELEEALNGPLDYGEGG